MSYIDVFQHEHCGYITGIPVYRLLESSLEEVEFIATPHQLLVGGGSGEHPAVVFAPARSVHELTQSLLGDIEREQVDLDSLEFYNVTPAMLKRVAEATASERPTAFEQWKYTYSLFPGPEVRALMPAGLTEEEAYAWEDEHITQVDHWGELEELASHQLNGRPWVKGAMSLERWYEASLGEYFLVSYPSLLWTDSTLQTLHTELQRMQALLKRHPAFCNVLQLPSGYDLLGRGGSLGEPNTRR